MKEAKVVFFHPSSFIPHPFSEEPSMHRPLIGVAMQTLPPIPGQIPLGWGIGQKYVKALLKAGANPLLIPALPEEEQVVRVMYEQADGIFLAGGHDLDPALYGEAERHPTCDEPDHERDWTELRLVRWALEDDKPLLGVCRGIQSINVAAGGTLYQHVPDQHPGAIKHDYFSMGEGTGRDYLAHAVRIEPGSRLSAIMGVDEVMVTSMHHQGVKAIARGFRPGARAEDGLVEAIEHVDRRFVLGVQWHAEELVGAHEPMRRLFRAFVEAAGSRGP
jgi:putative glutamine amidotransferase